MPYCKQAAQRFVAVCRAARSQVFPFMIKVFVLHTKGVR
jgi:hypothetical protein